MSAARLVLIALLLFALQGALSVVLPAGFPAPDLFLLAAVALYPRLRPLSGLFVATGIGLVQDIFGLGLIGFHAAALAVAVYVVYLVRRLFSAETGLNRLLAVAGACVGKWAVFVILNYWTRQGLLAGGTFVHIVVPDVALTLLLAPFVYALIAWALGPVSSAEERLL
ncbi:MAG TPA: rod shape-determining protein MreD [Deinococcales bacterium]|nr:rod shape-determining protein MreD [Deinococcales bacterium]